MRLGLYIHPHDILPDPVGVLREVADLGFAEIAVACAYHAGRWTCPRGERVVRFLEDGVVHFRARARGPVPPRWSSLVPASGPDPIDSILDAAAPLGLEVHAWTVCFHNTPLATARAGLALENAFGDPMLHALCPSRAEVRAYAAGLAAELGGKRGLAALELEAAGFMGYAHGSHHEKSSFRFSRYQEFLLSLCFCAGCREACSRAGVDTERTAARVRELLTAVIRDGDVLDPAAAEQDDGVRAALERDLGAGALEGMLTARTKIVLEVLGEVRSVLKADVRLTAMVEPDPLFAGSQIGIDPARVVSILSGLVLTHYGQSQEARERAWRAMGSVPGSIPCAAAFWPRRAEFARTEDLAAAASACEAKGAATIRIYHFGLLPRRTLARVAEELRRLG